MCNCLEVMQLAYVHYGCLHCAFVAGRQCCSRVSMRIVLHFLCKLLHCRKSAPRFETPGIVFMVLLSGMQEAADDTRRPPLRLVIVDLSPVPHIDATAVRIFFEYNPPIRFLHLTTHLCAASENCALHCAQLPHNAFRLSC